MTCRIPNGCILHEQSGACPLCDEDGADRIAEWCFDHPEDRTGNEDCRTDEPGVVAPAKLAR